jgi:hypothetical protein
VFHSKRVVPSEEERAALILGTVLQELLPRWQAEAE